MARHSNTGKLVRLALFVSIALIVFIIEAQFPSPVVYIPGMKLGLSNVVTVILLATESKKDAFFVLMTRIFLGSFFAGQMISLAYSLIGGLLSFGAMCVTVMILGKDSLWFTGIVGGVVHNIGQVLAAWVLMKTEAVFAYLPYLILFGIGTGLFCGISAMFIVKHMKKIFPENKLGEKKT